MFVTVVYLSLLIKSGFSLVVLQPGDLISPPGVTVTLECRMGTGYSMSSQTMLWYRQNYHGAQMEFILKEYEESVGRFRSSIETSKNLFSLQIPELSLNDSSIYYCAASHSEAYRSNTHTNNQTVC
ncbi:hypothetical protein AMECASPLE_036962, partial [Ameca splendens]